MKLTYTKIFTSLVGGATIAFAFSGTVAHAQTDIYSSYTPANPTGVTPLPIGSGNNLSGDNNYNGNGDWSTDTFELSSGIQSVTDPTIVFFTAVPQADLGNAAPANFNPFTGINALITTNSAAETSLLSGSFTETIPGNIATSYTGDTLDSADIYEVSFTYTGGALAGGTDYYLQLSNELTAADDMYWVTLPTATATGADSTGVHAGGGHPGAYYTYTDPTPDAFEILAPTPSNPLGGSISYTPEPSPAVALLVGVAGVGGLLAFGARRKNACSAA